MDNIALVSTENNSYEFEGTCTTEDMNSVLPHKAQYPNMSTGSSCFLYNNKSLWMYEAKADKWYKM